MATGGEGSKYTFVKVYIENTRHGHLLGIVSTKRITKLSVDKGVSPCQNFQNCL
jgi:hypothetical protein